MLHLCRPGLNGILLTTIETVSLWSSKPTYLALSINRGLLNGLSFLANAIFLHNSFLYPFTIRVSVVMIAAVGSSHFTELILVSCGSRMGVNRHWPLIGHEKTCRKDELSL
jgi:hypothetical protein